MCHANVPDRPQSALGLRASVRPAGQPPVVPSSLLSTSRARCNTRILRPLARRLRAWSYYFHNLVIWTHNHLNRIYHSLSHSLSLSRDLSLSLTSLTGSPSPPSPLSSRFQNLPFQLDSKAKGASLGVGKHLLQVFQLGVTSFSSFSCKRS